MGDDAQTSKENYRRISYREHIVPWLNALLRECACVPILRETIRQYVNTIEWLTGGSAVNGSLRNVLCTNIRAAHEIYVNYDRLVDDAVRGFAKELEERIGGDLSSSDWKIENQVDVDWETDGRGLIIANSCWARVMDGSSGSEDAHKRQFGIKWEREPKNSRRSVYGFVAHRDCFDRKRMDEKLVHVKKRMEECGTATRSDQWWSIRAHMKETDFRSDINQLEILVSDTKRPDLVERVASRLIEFATACDLQFSD